jgi:hypothetical protein
MVDWTASMTEAMRKLTVSLPIAESINIDIKKPIDEINNIYTTKMHALEVIEKTLEFLVSSGARSHAPSDDIYKYTSINVDDFFFRYQSPFSGATLGNNYVLEIWYGSEEVLLAKWTNEDDTCKRIYRFQPGAWLEKL